MKSRTRTYLGSVGCAVVVLAAALGLCRAGESPVVESQPMIGEAAPAFELVEVTGAKVSLETLRGQWLVVHFGASW